MKFGFIGFGEVSYTLSKMLLSYGFEVLTSTEGRSKKTKELVKSLNLTVLDNFEEVAHQSDILISANSPQSALAVALQAACENLKINAGSLLSSFKSTTRSLYFCQGSS